MTGFGRLTLRPREFAVRPLLVWSQAVQVAGSSGKGGGFPAAALAVVRRIRMIRSLFSRIKALRDSIRATSVAICSREAAAALAASTWFACQAAWVTIWAASNATGLLAASLR